MMWWFLAYVVLGVGCAGGAAVALDARNDTAQRVGFIIASFVGWPLIISGGLYFCLVRMLTLKDALVFRPVQIKINAKINMGKTCADLSNCAPVKTTKSTKSLGATAKRRMVKLWFEQLGSDCTECGVGMIKPEPGKNHQPKNCATIDHILARARGGTHDLQNLRVICQDCNYAKGAKKIAA